MVLNVALLMEETGVPGENHRTAASHMLYPVHLIITHNFTA
jgi:hypothetical protein